MSSPKFAPRVIGSDGVTRLSLQEHEALLLESLTKEVEYNTQRLVEAVREARAKAFEEVIEMFPHIGGFEIRKLSRMAKAAREASSPESIKRLDDCVKAQLKRAAKAAREEGKP